MLLTSGQVSVAISSIVVFLFTAALFLSGYVLQQKTVRDIRVAIRPQVVSMQDRLYLPSQFDTSQIQVLGDGESEVVVNLKQSSGSDQPDTKSAIELRGAKSSVESNANQRNEDQKPVVLAEDKTPVQDGSSDKPILDSDSAKPPGDATEEKPLSAAARRKKIKEEVLAAGEGEGYKGYRRRMW